MPFVKVRRNTYRSPSGKILTKAQVQAYYAKTRSILRGKK